MNRRRIQSTVSSLLLVMSVGLLVVVGVLYLRDRNDPVEPPRPTSTPGHYQLIDVVDVIKDAGVDATFGKRGTDVRSAILERPGQLLTLESGRAYVFIYSSPGDREDATLDVLPDEIDLADVDGNPIDAEIVGIIVASNIAVVIIETEPDVLERIEDAIATLQ